MGLIASVIENQGIPTLCLSLLREVTSKVKPPRCLFLPFPDGHALGKANERELRHRIIHSVLELLEETSADPLLRHFVSSASAGA